MSDSTRPVLRDAEFLSALLDTLIPPGGNRPMPGAGGIGIEPAVAESLVGDANTGANVVATLEALREQTPAFVSLPAPERAKVVEARASLDAASMRALLRHVYLAYYQHPTVLAALGEPPRPPFPEGFEIEPTDPELLAALRRRAGV
ncbi:MAG: hypothetical protein AB7J35_02380 [Dehalococcoidia bacterium]